MIFPDEEEGEQSAFQKEGINCPGERPWLGDHAAEANCNHALVAALINQTNLYFSRTISAIALPDLEIRDDSIAKLRNEIEQDASTLGVAKTLWTMGNHEAVVAMVQSGLKRRQIDSEPASVEAALESLFNGKAPTVPGAAVPSEPESDLLAFRRAEFNIIRNEVNDPEKTPDLRVLPADVSPDITNWVQKVSLVERLRVTKAFFGFDRFNSSGSLEGMPAKALHQLFRSPPSERQEGWLPAVETFGEGIYVELSEDGLQRWQRANSDWILARLNDGFVERLAAVYQTIPPLTAATTAWAARYMLVHTLAHILINQLVFECGYSTASLRERLYVSADPEAPMAAFLIYTAAGDSEGTLGGLVRLGRPSRLDQVLFRAIDRASWCSADPVCSEHLGGQGARLANMAACHACALLPETACETMNQGLDRAVIVGTPTARDKGYMSSLIGRAYVQG